MPLPSVKDTERMKRWVWGSLIVAAAISGVGFLLALPWVVYLGFALFSVWLLCISYAFGFVLPPRAMPFGVVGVLVAVGGAVVVTRGWLIVSALSIAVGLAGGMIARLLLEHRSRVQRDRLAALPLWERDELGETAATLRPAYRRNVDPTDVSLPHVTAKIVAAVCRPLPGSTVIVSTNELRPVIAVYGSRVAVVYGPGAGSVTPRESSVSEAPENIIAQSLPEGAKYRVFEVDGGLDAPSTGRIAVSVTEPHELAAFLGGGAPANGDAIVGRAAHIHQRVLVSLTHNGLYAGVM